MMSSWTGFRTLIWREVFRFLSVISQTVFPPLVSSFLFILIFGLSLGTRIDEVQGMPYLHFLIPGMIMMHVIEGAYANTSSSLFISRWANNIEELLVTPLSYFEMVLAMLLGGLARSLVTAFGVWGVSLFFARVPVAHPAATLFFLIFVSLIFSAAGMIAALFSEEFEHLTLATTFFITPLVFLGGVFHSITMVPASLKVLTSWNPIFYMVDGMRYGMLGTSDVESATCVTVVLVIFTGLFLYTVYLFRTGYKLRK